MTNPPSAPSATVASLATRPPSRWAFVRWFQRHPVVFDGGMAVVLALLTVIPLYDPGNRDGSLGHTADALGVLLLLAATLPITVRRRHPVGVLVVVVAAVTGFELIGYPEGAALLPVLVVIYTVASLCPPKISLRCLAVVEALVVPVTYLQWTRHAEDTPLVASIISSAVVLALPWVLGENINHRRRSFTEMRERAERAERDQAVEAQRAVDEERARIARELHDVVAHAMSVMVVQAGGARRVLPDHPDQAAEALRVIESTGRAGLDEMRRLLGVLRASSPATDRPNPELAPQPGARQLPALVQSWQAAGLPTDLKVTGHLEELPPGMDLTVYRLVQEALTNTFKHAGTAQAHVAIEVDATEVRVTITDDGRGAAAVAAEGTGHGLVGMRERVALYGGEVQAGPATGGGFAVRARLPLARRDVSLPVP